MVPSGHTWIPSMAQPMFVPPMQGFPCARQPAFPPPPGLVPAKQPVPPPPPPVMPELDTKYSNAPWNRKVNDEEEHDEGETTEEAPADEGEQANEAEGQEADDGEQTNEAEGQEADDGEKTNEVEGQADKGWQDVGLGPGNGLTVTLVTFGRKKRGRFAIEDNMKFSDVEINRYNCPSEGDRHDSGYRNMSPIDSNKVNKCCGMNGRIMLCLVLRDEFMATAHAIKKELRFWRYTRPHANVWGDSRSIKIHKHRYESFSEGT